ncbi:MAG TPA: sigma-E factor negative regulatory protein [Burkholderiaceae bacterium]|nr:sigma-E factor negative regulatory protein [Burkholderiaceae bacterium]
MPDEPTHSPQQQPNDEWAALSSLADGEATADTQERCLALWAEQAAARERWRQYQLIGDVLRSRELAREDAHDAAFLAALRARLAREPVVLRPARAAIVQRFRSWAAPLAAGAGVAAVAGVVAMLGSTPVSFESAPLARAPVAGSEVVQPALAPTPESTQRVNGRLIRDARLDRYFAAHRQSGTGAALQMPGGVVRSVDTIVLEDR